MYPPELLPLLQSLLATVADIDFEHESDVETVRNSSVDEWLKQTTIRKLHECHRERRMPYVQQLESLQRRLRAWLPRWFPHRPDYVESEVPEVSSLVKRSGEAAFFTKDHETLVRRGLNPLPQSFLKASLTESLMPPMVF